LILGVLSNAIKIGNGGKSVKRCYSRIIHQEIQIIKKKLRLMLLKKKVALSDTQKSEPVVKAKPRPSKKNLAQKGILEFSEGGGC
jgi:hypothetical protein